MKVRRLYNILVDNRISEHVIEDEGWKLRKHIFTAELTRLLRGNIPVNL